MFYSISDLEQLTGVSAHSIRIWERRYKALSPMRSSGNTRMYSDDQLRRLLNISALSDAGHKISSICALSEKAMDKLLEEAMTLAGPKNTSDAFEVSQLINRGLAYDEQGFDARLDALIARMGMESSYSRIIYPLLLRLGLLWGRDQICPAQEHFISNIIRRKLFSAINDIKAGSPTGKTWLLFLPEDEDHETGLLYAHYLLKKKGHKVIFLGAKTPIESVTHAFTHNTVDAMLLFMVGSRPSEDAGKYLKNLSGLYNRSKIYVAGNEKLLGQLEFKNNLSWMRGVETFEAAANEVSSIR